MSIAVVVLVFGKCLSSSVLFFRFICRVLVNFNYDLVSKLSESVTTYIRVKICTQILLEIQRNVCNVYLLSISGLRKPAYIDCLIHQQFNVPISWYNFPLLLENYNFVTLQLQDYMYSIGKHIFCSFVAIYDYKFYNHLVIVIFYRFIFVFERSFKSRTRKPGATYEMSTWKYLLLFYTCSPVHPNQKLRCIKKRPPRVDGGSVNFVLHYSC